MTGEPDLASATAIRVLGSTPSDDPSIASPSADPISADDRPRSLRRDF